MTKIRNNRTRFQRFVAEKKQKRAKRFHPPARASTNLSATLATSIKVHPALEIHHGDTNEELDAPPYYLREWQTFGASASHLDDSSPSPGMVVAAEASNLTTAEAVAESPNVVATTYATAVDASNETLTEAPNTPLSALLSSFC